ncbi:hypothetical protein PVAP13_1KG104000 [Panicum virgatum]|uniref:Uncharacterized protein n=1 Tax=Panicum virgatum TaxID=38727 RepID=A0A8T0XHK0_PANVG|nr:hypothetical protein PVAP13_1KG104000 [Panicum virgatum]
MLVVYQLLISWWRQTFSCFLSLHILQVLILLSNMILRLILGWLWCLIHMAISLFDLWSCLMDSREAKNVMEVKQLLHWFSTVGIKYVVLYDIEGVIKESIEHGIETSRDENTSNFSNICANTKSSHCSHGGMVIECLSGSDGKEGIAKAANLLYSASCKGCNNYATYTHGYDKMDTVFTEADMASALRAVAADVTDSQVDLWPAGYSSRTRTVAVYTVATAVTVARLG